MISHDVQYDDFEDDDECSDLEDSQVASSLDVIITSL